MSLPAVLSRLASPIAPGELDLNIFCECVPSYSDEILRLAGSPYGPYITCNPSDPDVFAEGGKHCIPSRDFPVVLHDAFVNVALLKRADDSPLVDPDCMTGLLAYLDGVAFDRLPKGRSTRTAVASMMLYSYYMLKIRVDNLVALMAHETIPSDCEWLPAGSELKQVFWSSLSPRVRFLIERMGQMIDSPLLDVDRRMFQAGQTVTERVQVLSNSPMFRADCSYLAVDDGGRVLCAMDHVGKSASSIVHMCFDRSLISGEARTELLKAVEVYLPSMKASTTGAYITGPHLPRSVELSRLLTNLFTKHLPVMTMGRCAASSQVAASLIKECVPVDEPRAQMRTPSRRGR